MSDIAVHSGMFNGFGVFSTLKAQYLIHMIMTSMLELRNPTVY